MQPPGQTANAVEANASIPRIKSTNETIAARVTRLRDGVCMADGLLYFWMPVWDKAPGCRVQPCTASASASVKPVTPDDPNGFPRLILVTSEPAA